MKYLPFLSILLFTVSTSFTQTRQPVLTGADKLKMYAQHEEMRAASEFDSLHWQYLGPTNISGRCTDVEAVMPKGKSSGTGCPNRDIWAVPG